MPPVWVSPELAVFYYSIANFCYTADMKIKGFTLIELLVVIAIIGLLGSLSVVGFSASREKARLAKGLGFDAQIRRAAGDEAVGVFDFDECSGTTSVDQSGNGNTATLVNTPAWSTDTPSGKGCSLALNGSGQYVTVGGAMSQLIGNGPLTVSMWVKSNTQTWTNFDTFISTRTGNAMYILVGDSSTRNLGAYIGNGTTFIERHFSYAGDLTKWHQYVISYDGNIVSWYIDGSLAGQSTATGNFTMNAGNSTTYIGYDYPIAGRYINGFIDSVRVYKKTLTAWEIRNRFASEGGIRGVTAVTR